MPKPVVPDPLAVTLRPIWEGENYSSAVEGGVARRKVYADGLVVGTADRDIFFPIKDVVDQLARLGLVVSPIKAQAIATPVRAGGRGKT